MIRSTLAAALFVLPLAAFAQAPLAPAGPARFVDAVDWPTSEAGLERFNDLEARMSGSFASVCADTFCEGDFGNLRPMELKCSVDATKGTLKQCLWTFSGSYGSVNPKTGAVQSTAKLFKCKLLLSKDTPVDAFYEALAGDHPAEAKLPMSRYSTYDGLVGCL